MARASMLLSIVGAASVLYCGAASLDDDVALLQSPSPDIDRSQSKKLFDMVMKSVNEEGNPSNLSKPAHPTYDCDAHPHYCEAPFHCDTFPAEVAVNWIKEGLGSRGPDPRALCMISRNEHFYHECLVKKNLVKAAHLQQFLSRVQLAEESENDADSSYCFVEGLCVEDGINENSTADDAVKVCDRRYGRESWSTFGSAAFNGRLSLGSPSSGAPSASAEFGIIRSRSTTIPFALAACAMGTFHCDVMLCKETYCKDKTANRRYAFQQVKEGWVPGNGRPLRSSYELGMM